MFTLANLRRIEQRSYAWVANWGRPMAADDAIRMLLCGAAVATSRKGYEIVAMFELN